MPGEPQPEPDVDPRGPVWSYDDLVPEIADDDGDVPTEAPSPDDTNGEEEDGTSTEGPTGEPSRPRETPAGLIFGLGPTADWALESPLVEDAPVRLLTTWFNQSEDLEWLRFWRDTLIPEAYADGYGHHLVVFDAGPAGPVDTPYGEACGQTYALSDRLLDDLRELAQIFRGDGPLYVTMFSELQTYPCDHNQWQGSEAYYRALQDQYLAAMHIFHEANPNARVSLGWGGWQGRWDEPSVGGGRSLIGHFSEVLACSDFQSFQAMQSDSNLDDVRTMTRLLAQYGPVMVAHYLPDDSSPRVWDADLAAIFTDEVVAELTRAGLFAFSFMDPLLLENDARLQRATEVVRTYAADSLVPATLDGQRGGGPDCAA